MFDDSCFGDCYFVLYSTFCSDAQTSTATTTTRQASDTTETPQTDTSDTTDRQTAADLPSISETPQADTTDRQTAADLPSISETPQADTTDRQTAADLPSISETPQADTTDRQTAADLPSISETPQTDTSDTTMAVLHDDDQSLQVPSTGTENHKIHHKIIKSICFVGCLQLRRELLCFFFCVLIGPDLLPTAPTTATARPEANSPIPQTTIESTKIIDFRKSF